MTGIRAAVIAGIGVSVMGQSEVTSDMRKLGPEIGLPSLPGVPILLYHASDQFLPTGRSLTLHLRRFAFDR